MGGVSPPEAAEADMVPSRTVSSPEAGSIGQRVGNTPHRFYSTRLR